jgi:hypothetical protein
MRNRSLWDWAKWLLCECRVGQLKSFSGATLSAKTWGPAAAQKKTTSSPPVVCALAIARVHVSSPTDLHHLGQWSIEIIRLGGGRIYFPTNQIETCLQLTHTRKYIRESARSKLDLRFHLWQEQWVPLILFAAWELKAYMRRQIVLAECSRVINSICQWSERNNISQLFAWNERSCMQTSAWISQLCNLRNSCAKREAYSLLRVRGN